MRAGSRAIAETLCRAAAAVGHQSAAERASAEGAAADGLPAPVADQRQPVRRRLVVEAGLQQGGEAGCQLSYVRCRLLAGWLHV